MSKQLDDALGRVLSSAADGAPDSPPDLVYQVETRHRSRRRRSYAAVAGIAVFAMISGIGLMLGNQPSAKRGPDYVGVPAARGGDSPIADVWPEAYHSLWAKLEDGRKYYPMALINGHQMLVTTESRFEKSDELWIIDLRAKRAHRLARLPEPHKNQKLFASRFTVGSGHVVWWDSYTDGDQSYTRIWKVALNGGQPNLVSTVTGSYGTADPVMGDRLTVHGNTVYFSHGIAGGVRKVSLSGGDAIAVPNTKGYHLLQWPWVATPGLTFKGEPPCHLGPDNQPQCPGRGGELDMSADVLTTIRNLETGEERKAVVPEGVVGVACHVTYCTGSKDNRSVMFKRDGSALRNLPGQRPVDSMPTMDRFLVLRNGKDYHLYDLKSGKSGELDPDQQPNGGRMVPMSWAPDARLLCWTINGKSYAIMDLAAIK